MKAVSLTPSPGSPLGTDSIVQTSGEEFLTLLSELWHRSQMCRDRAGGGPCGGAEPNLPGGLLTFCTKGSCPAVEELPALGDRWKEGERGSFHDHFWIISNDLKTALHLAGTSRTSSLCKASPPQRSLPGSPSQAERPPLILPHSPFHPQHFSQYIRISLPYLRAGLRAVSLPTGWWILGDGDHASQFTFCSQGLAQCLAHCR